MTSVTPADRVVRELESGSLGRALAKAFAAAEQLGEAGLARWCRLEAEGYLASNSAMGEDVVVPEYRTVVGEHYDLGGRLFLPPASVAFVNGTRLRYGVDELEDLAKTRDVVVMQDPLSNLIQEHLGVDVHTFRFSSVHLIGVLSAIRMELIARLESLRRHDPVLLTNGPADEILNLRPNLYGVGFDLRALLRRFRRGDKSL